MHISFLVRRRTPITLSLRRQASIVVWAPHRLPSFQIGRGPPRTEAILAFELASKPGKADGSPFLPRARPPLSYSQLDLFSDPDLSWSGALSTSQAAGFSGLESVMTVLLFSCAGSAHASSRDAAFSSSPEFRQ